MPVAFCPSGADVNNVSSPRFGAGGFQQQEADMQGHAVGNFIGAMFGQNVGQQSQQQTTQAGQYSRNPAPSPVSFIGQFNPSGAAGHASASQPAAGHQNAYA